MPLKVDPESTSQTVHERRATHSPTGASRKIRPCRTLVLAQGDPFWARDVRNCRRINSSCLSAKCRVAYWSATGTPGPSPGEHGQDRG